MNPLAEAALKSVDLPKRGIQLSSFADVDGVGTGLATSAAFLVAMYAALRGNSTERALIAEAAFATEAFTAGRYAGKQDAYHAALGGLHALAIGANGRVDAEPIEVTSAFRDYVRQRVMVFHSGVSRPSDFMTDQRVTEPPDLRRLDAVLAIAAEMRDALLRDALDHIGPLILEHWRLKRGAGHHPPEIDRVLQLAGELGADGWKLLGAGGGGYVLVTAPLSATARIRNGMKAHGIAELPFDLDESGLQTVVDLGWR